MLVEVRELMQLIDDGGASIFWLTATQARAKRMTRLEQTGQIVRRKDDPRDVYPWCVFEVPGVRVACYHARKGFPGGRSPRFGQRVLVLAGAPRGVHPRNMLIQFRDGTKMVTSIGCLRWICDEHGMRHPKVVSSERAD